jgi:hypothetical protein
MSILTVADGPPRWARAAYEAGQNLVKHAGEPAVSYQLAGLLYLDQSGWLLLGVPNPLVRGVYAALRAPGVELPPSDTREGLQAHISVMTKDEVDLVGPDRVNERGKQFHYTLGRLYEVEPDDWPGVDRVWYVRVHSPELQQLRRSYGLSSLPGGGEKDFHVTVAVRRRGVLGRTETAKS